MQPNGTIDINDTIAAWADITLKMWSQRLVSIPVYDTGRLLESLKYTLLINSGNNPERIDFSFKLYGIFVNYIEKKDWYDKLYYAQVMRLKEILTEKYINAAIFNVTFSMNPVNH